MEMQDSTFTWNILLIMKYLVKISMIANSLNFIENNKSQEKYPVLK